MVSWWISKLGPLPASRTSPPWLSTSPESSCQLPMEDLMIVWLCLENWKRKIREKAKWKFNIEMFTLYDVKMIQIWTFPAAPSTKCVPSLAERVAYLRYSINLRLFNWRVPGLIFTPFACLTCPIILMSSKGVTNLTWFSINQFPLIDKYLFKAAFSIDHLISVFSRLVILSGHLVVLRRWPVPRRPSCPSTTCAPLRSPSSSRKRPPCDQVDQVGQGGDVEEGEQELLRNLLKSKETTLWLQKQKTPMPSIR